MPIYDRVNAITVDSTGQPQIRTMYPFPLKIEFITWFATSRTSRKGVRQNLLSIEKIMLNYQNIDFQII